MTMWARSLVTRLAVVTPSAWRRSTSIRNTLGSTTTPCPMTHIVEGLRMPLGMRWNLYSFPPVTTVWPALLPPCERTTMSTRSESRSMTLPLPSSPHCPPTRMVTLIAAPTLTEAPECALGGPESGQPVSPSVLRLARVARFGAVGGFRRAAVRVGFDAAARALVDGPEAAGG